MEFGRIDRELYIDASPEIVFDVVSNPKHVSQWWPDEATYEAVPGSSGQIAFGDCADVILAGVAGRDPAFNAKDHIDYVKTEVADALRGRDVTSFKRNAEEMDRFEPGGKRLHTAVRYGVSQALLHATSLAHKVTMAEVIAREYGSTISKTKIPILASCHKDDHGQLDRARCQRYARSRA